MRYECIPANRSVMSNQLVQCRYNIHEKGIVRVAGSSKFRTNTRSAEGLILRFHPPVSADFDGRHIFVVEPEILTQRTLVIPAE